MLQISKPKVIPIVKLGPPFRLIISLIITPLKSSSPLITSLIKKPISAPSPCYSSVTLLNRNCSCIGLLPYHQQRRCRFCKRSRRQRRLKVVVLQHRFNGVRVRVKRTRKNWHCVSLNIRRRWVLVLVVVKGRDLASFRQEFWGFRVQAFLQLRFSHDGLNQADQFNFSRE